MLPQSFNARAMDRFRRLPRLFESLALKVRIACSCEKSPSSPIGNAVKRYNMSISREYSQIYATGSMTFPIDFDIFCPSTVKNPVVSSCLGATYHALQSIASQYIPWNFTISLPMTWISAGHHFGSLS